jgi:hypothetical protein
MATQLHRTSGLGLFSCEPPLVRTDIRRHLAGMARHCQAPAARHTLARCASRRACNDLSTSVTEQFSVRTPVCRTRRVARPRQMPAVNWTDIPHQSTRPDTTRAGGICTENCRELNGPPPFGGRTPVGAPVRPGHWPVRRGATGSTSCDRPVPVRCSARCASGRPGTAAVLRRPTTPRIHRVFIQRLAAPLTDTGAGGVRRRLRTLAGRPE